MEVKRAIATLEKTLSEKRLSLQRILQDLQQASSQDTKSSMGDKYETSREMVKQEMLKIGAQLKLAIMQEASLKKIIQRTPVETISYGSLIQTNHGWFFLGIPAGKLIVDEQSIFCLSIESPLGAELFGKNEGAEFTFREKVYRIENIQ